MDGAESRRVPCIELIRFMPAVARTLYLPNEYRAPTQYARGAPGE